MNPFKFSTWQEEVPLPAKGELQMFVWQNSQVPGSRGESHECRVHACSDSLRPHGLKPTRLLCPWDSPGKNTGGFAIPSSRGSSQPRDGTCVSCIAGGFFTFWAIRKPVTIEPGQKDVGRLLEHGKPEASRMWMVSALQRNVNEEFRSVLLWKSLLSMLVGCFEIDGWMDRQTGRKKE